VPARGGAANTSWPPATNYIGVDLSFRVLRALFCVARLGLVLRGPSPRLVRAPTVRICRFPDATSIRLRHDEPDFSAA